MQVPLTQNLTALVDEADHERVSKHKWHARKGIYGFYAARNVNLPSGKRGIELLHRFILGLSDPKISIDHINHDGLDCQRHNLRSATPSQNQANRRKAKTKKSSRFKGVSWHSQNKNWRAVIMSNRHLQHIGSFKSEIEAAKAYDAAATRIFGDFAHTNFATN